MFQKITFASILRFLQQKYNDIYIHQVSFLVTKDTLFSLDSATQTWLRSVPH